MRHLIESILEKNLTLAKDYFAESISDITIIKLEEMKKMIMAKEQFRAAFDGGPGARREKLKRDVIEEDELEENIDPSEPTGEAPKTGQRVNQVGKGDRENTTVVPKNNLREEDQLDEMPNTSYVNYSGGSSGHEIYTKSTKNPFNRGTEVKVSSYKQSVGDATQTIKNKIKTKDLGNNNLSIGSSTSVSTVKEESDEQLDEARVKIVKARIRGGKIQRRKKVSTQPGFTYRGGKLTRMSPMERRRRKLGAKRGKIKRRAKMARSLQKRKRSLMKRKAIGL